MLQIIGWLGCLYLMLKGVEMLQRGLAQPAGSASRTLGHVGVIVAFLGAGCFMLLLNAQAKGSGELPSFGGSSIPSSSGTSASDLENIADNLEAAADNATIDDMTARDAQTGNTK